MAHDDTIVELEGVNGEWFTWAGPDAGDRGQYLGTGVKGLFDPPVKVVYEEPGNYPGARYLSHRIQRRDLTLMILIVDDPARESWAASDSELRKALAYDRDAYLHVTTPESGHRKLAVRLGDAPDVDLDTDPHLGRVVKVVLTLIAGDPFWYEDDKVFTVTTKTDTRYDPTKIPFPWTRKVPPFETLFINVAQQLNPTDQYIWPKWSVAGATDKPPGIKFPYPPGATVNWRRAPMITWTIPDYSFEDPELENRRLRLPGLIYGENCVIDSDPRVEQISSDIGSQVWARMNGVRFRHPIPPYTLRRKFEITVTGAAAGQMVALRLPRPWSRPWGLE